MPTTEPPASAGPAPRSTRWLATDLSTLVKACADDPALVYDLVIVGSGYGGAMAAAQLAGANIPGDAGEPGRPLKLCVLERGAEYLPGSFPSRLADLATQVRVATDAQSDLFGKPLGLLDFRVGADVSALVANGLGGGSLINAAVMLKPQFGSFNSRMPQLVEDQLKNRYLDEAKTLLGARRTRADGTTVNNTVRLRTDAHGQPLPSLPKTQGLRAMGLPQAEDLQDEAVPDGDEPDQGLPKFRFTPLTIEMQGGRNGEGVELKPCSLCGDCMTGCNVGARESLDTNLLVRAKRRGAELYTGASVLRLERKQQLWELEVVYTDRALRDRQKNPLRLKARKVILAAGTLGSTEILLRSQARTPTLAFSDRLGTQFSCNGDNLAAIYKSGFKLQSVADESQPLADPAAPRGVGPTITGYLDVKPQSGLPGPSAEPRPLVSPGFLLQEFSVPAPLKRVFEELLTTTQVLQGFLDEDPKPVDPSRDPLAVDPAAVEHSMVVGFIGHDDANGSVRLKPPGRHSSRDGDGDVVAKPLVCEGSVRIEWPSAATGTAINQSFEYFTRLSQPHLNPEGGRVLPNPAWRPLPPALEGLIDKVRGPVLTVHPLGGCPMGESIATGVVDGHGMVYQRQAGTATTAGSPADPWEGTLFVLDGAIVPASLGANPSLTIAALSLRACDHWLTAGRWVTRSTTEPGNGPPSWSPLRYPRPVARTPERCTTGPGTPTQLQVIERLNGRLAATPPFTGRPDLWLELSFGFQPGTVKELTEPLRRRRPLDTALSQELPYVNRLRVFDADTWAKLALNCADEEVRDEQALVVASLSGHMDMLDREPGIAWLRRMQAWWAFVQNRGLRDLVRGWKEREPGGDCLLRAFFNTLKISWQIARRASEVRRLDYTAQVAEVLREKPDWRGLVQAGMPIAGNKRFTYARRANPWNQLLYLSLTQFPLRGYQPSGSRPAMLKLDARFLARQGVPLARVVGQQDQPNALADLAQFGLYGLRLFLSMHFWSFRKPDAPRASAPCRLPGNVAGLPPPEIREIELAPPLSGFTGPIRVRLTRYPRRNARPAKPGQPDLGRPLVLIHGYSASGTTFAHDALEPGMANYFWQKGRDIWIVDLRTSSGMPTATHAWKFEEAAWADIPVAIEHIVQQVAHENPGLPPVQVDVFAHCVGAVMFSMALLTPPDGTPELPYRAQLDALPGRVHRIVLSQKSFALEYSDANVLRAFAMRFLRKLVLPDQYSFRPPVFPGLKDRFMDLFLAALPYPVEEFDRENPGLFDTAPWLIARHRMDALYERTFSVNNMSDKVLMAIDDLFGPLNTQTVSQTIHFARNHCITDAAGRNIFVSAKSLARWPKGGTLGLHGENNGMVDKHSLQLTTEWMALAGIPYEARSMKDMGHQDSLIGLNARNTFEAVETFLDAALAPPTKDISRNESPLLFEPPWFGPRAHNRLDDSMQILIGTHPGHAAGVAVIVPVRRQGGHFVPVRTRQEDFYAQRVQPTDGWLALDLAALTDAAELAQADGVLVLLSYLMPEPEWQFPLQAQPNRQARIQFAALGLQPFNNHISLGQGQLLEAGLVQGPLPIPAPAPTVSLSDIQTLCSDHPQQDFDLAFIAAPALAGGTAVAAHGMAPTEGSTPVSTDGSFAFASCQFPAGILDSTLAQASYQRLHQLVQAAGPKAPRKLLLLGDQIYADATAGLLDPTRMDDRYKRPYDDLFRIPALRALMRQVPVLMMPDDHEIVDNYEPGNSLQAQKWFTQGVSAYWQYQRPGENGESSGAPPQRPPIWRKETLLGFPLFMTDTRTERLLRQAETANPPPSIMSLHQMTELKAWLLQLSRNSDSCHRPKFISSAAMLLPRRIGIDGSWSGSLSRDAWDGYPASLMTLLVFIADMRIRNVVFLSGDEHLANVCEITVGGTRIISIHAPALYAPFPFANSTPDTFAGEEAFDVSDGTRTLSCQVKATHFPPEENGFVVVMPQRLPADAGSHQAPGWQLTIEVHGRQPAPWSRTVSLG